MQPLEAADLSMQPSLKESLRLSYLQRTSTFEKAATTSFPLKTEHTNSHPNPGHVLSHFLAHIEERIHHIFLLFPVDIAVYPWSGCAEL